MASTFFSTVTLDLSALSASKKMSALEAIAKTCEKYGIAFGNATSATPVSAAEAVATPRTFDIPVGTADERIMISSLLDPLRGKGMVERVVAALGIPFPAASALVSAESPAKRDNRGLMADSKSRDNLRAGYAGAMLIIAGV